MKQFPTTNRKVDILVESQAESLGQRLRLVAKKQITLWKALLVTMFIAGFAAALTWAVSEEYFSQSKAKAVVGRPDLVIEQIVVQAEGSQQVLSVVVRNSSSVALTDDVRVTVINRTIGSEKSLSKKFSRRRPLAAQAEVVLKGDALQPGSYSIEAIVDPKNKIPESNEQNNTLSHVVSVPPTPLPQTSLNVTVTSPAQDEKWEVGNAYTVRWTPYYVVPPTPVSGNSILPRENTTVTISLSPYYACSDASPPCVVPAIAPYLITSTAPNTGSYLWKIPPDLSSLYKGIQKITVVVNGTKESGTSAPFTIVEQRSSLNVTSPAQDEKWEVGNAYTVRWTPYYVVPPTPVSGNSILPRENTTVTISLSPYYACSDASPPCVVPAIAPYLITSTAPNTGSYLWKIPPDLSSLYKGIQKITVVVNGTKESGTSAPFTIVEHTLPSIVESFEQGFGEWTPQADNRVRDYKVTISQDKAFDGQQSVKMWIDGTKDDGTVWIQRSVLLPKEFQGQRDVPIEITFWLGPQDPVPIGSWPVVAYAGVRPPKLEEDFTRIGITSSGQPRNGEWGQYRYQTRVPLDPTSGSVSEITVAVGLSVNWEVIKTYYLDLVTITLGTTMGF